MKPTFCDHLKNNCPELIPFIPDQLDRDSEDRVERIKEVKKWFLIHPDLQSIPQVKSQIPLPVPGPCHTVSLHLQSCVYS